MEASEQEIFDAALHIAYEEEIDKAIEENSKLKNKNILEKIYEYGFEMFCRGIYKGIELSK